MKRMNNVFANVTENGFIPELQGVTIPEDSKLEVKFHKPEMLMSEQEKLDLIQKRIEMGLISNVEAIEIDRNVEREQALEIKKQIEGDEVEFKELEPESPAPPMFQPQVADDEVNIEDEDEELDGETEQSSQP